MVIAKTALLLFWKAWPFNEGAEPIMKYPTVTNFGGVTSQINCLLEMLLQPVDSKMMMSLSELINCAFEGLFLHKAQSRLALYLSPLLGMKVPVMENGGRQNHGLLKSP